MAGKFPVKYGINYVKAQAKDNIGRDFYDA
jgi:hypothetical protein